MPDDQELQRLKRHLRALSVVNRQMQAQLEGGTVRYLGGSGASGNNDLLASAGVELRRAPLRIRRVPEGGAWLEQLRLHGGAVAPFLVRTPNRGVYLVEGPFRRALNSGLLFGALRRRLGSVQDVSDSEIDRWSDGPPVEVMEAGSGPAFLVVGGRRLPIRGLPLPYPVSAEEMMLFPEGEELDLAAPTEPRSGAVARGRGLVAREGLVRGTAKLVRKAAGRVRRAIRRQPSSPSDVAS
jgi:hypothetical protein